MKTNIATDKNQSQRLLACGVPADTADMTLINGTLTLEPYSEAESPIDGFIHDYKITPAFSLSRLLELMPKEILIDGFKYRISIYFENPDEPVIGNQWCLYYKPVKHTEKSRIDDVPMYATDLIECAVLMAEKLHANNCKLNEIKEM